MNKVLGKGSLEYFGKIFSSATALQLLAFTLPLAPKFVPAMVIYALVCTIVDWKQNRAQPYFIIPKLSFWFIGFYLLHAVGILYSENKGAALFSLEVKLSLLLFPLVFLIGNLPFRIKLNDVLYSFIQGCLASAVLCVIHAAYKYYLSGDPGVFYYSSLSPYLHASYLSLYLNFGLFILLYLKVQGVFRSWTLVSFIGLIFIAFIIFLSSKAGIFSLFISFLILLVHQFITGNYKRGFLLLVLIGVIGTSIYYAIPVVRTRITMMKSLFVKESNEADSNVARTNIWKTAGKIFKGSPVLGVGPGDVNDSLVTEYDKAGLHEVSVRKLNAHNQYLQTLLGLGLIGLIVLLVSLLWPLLHSFKSGFWLYSAFLYLLIFNFLFESMLETQAGVVFYAFFNSLLFFKLWGMKEK